MKQLLARTGQTLQAILSRKRGHWLMTGGLILCLSCSVLFAACGASNIDCIDQDHDDYCALWDLTAGSPIPCAPGDECDCGGKPCDCNDLDQSINPGDTTTCDGIDHNCDGKRSLKEDELLDIDGDGYGIKPTTVEGSCLEVVPCTIGAADCPIIHNDEAKSNDCNDDDAAIYPEAEEQCADLDYNCDGLVDGDLDGDEHSDTSCGGDDCNDFDADTYPGSEDVCDSKDNDCDGTPDQDFDQDQDDSLAGTDCPTPIDCDDTNPDRSPLKQEQCDGLENDCDEQIDEGFDSDDDGIKSQETCGILGHDCDDADKNVYPGALEVSDNDIDDDCDGRVDEQTPQTPCWYYDGDGDGYGLYNVMGEYTEEQTISQHTPICSATSPGSHWILTRGDCDDENKAVHPYAVDTAGDELDSDCGGSDASELVTAIDDIAEKLNEFKGRSSLILWLDSTKQTETVTILPENWGTLSIASIVPPFNREKASRSGVTFQDGLIITGNGRSNGRITLDGLVFTTAPVSVVSVSDDPVYLQNSIVEDVNADVDVYGALEISGSNVNVHNSIIRSNGAEPAAVNVRAGSAVDISQTNIYDNAHVGLWVAGATASVNSSNIGQNSTSNGAENVHIQESTGIVRFVDSSLSDGGSIGTGSNIEIFASAVELDHTIISRGKGYSGGGLQLTNSSLLLTNSSILGSNANVYGGGLSAQGSVSEEASIEHQACDSMVCAALMPKLEAACEGSESVLEKAQDSFLVLSNTVVSENTAGGSGGGIKLSGRVGMTVCNSVISDNEAPYDAAVSVDYEVGDLDPEPAPELMLVNSAFISNQSTKVLGNADAQPTQLSFRSTGDLTVLNIIAYAPGVPAFQHFGTSSDNIKIYSCLMVPELDAHTMEMARNTLACTPKFLDGSLPAVRTLHLAADDEKNPECNAIDQGSSGTYDKDDTKADIGIYGGPGGARWDQDHDRLPDYFWPGAFTDKPDGFEYSAWDCNDLDPLACG